LLQQAPVSEAADLGAKATEEALPELRALFTPSRRLARQVRGLFGR
jgi:hypothetical protein